MTNESVNEHVKTKLGEVARGCVALAHGAVEERRVHDLLLNYFRNVAPADIERRSVPELFGLVKSHFEIARRLPVGQGTIDLQGITEIDEDTPLAFEMYAPVNPLDPANIRFKVFSIEHNVTLTKIMPHLTYMGAEVVDERAYEIEINGYYPMVYDLGLKIDGAQNWTEKDRERFMEVFSASYNGVLEAGPMNGLVNRGLNARDIAILRAISRYLQQANITYEQETVGYALVANAAIADQLMDLFFMKFDPADGRSIEDRKIACAGQITKIEKALESVASLDHDTILRLYLQVINAMVRTNVFQDGNQAMAFKMLPRELDFLPEPRPMFEIFVYCPRVEGVHLRYGKVARGGLRWSDRRDDFRTEILGLVKAQMVKNTVIVPVGAKGGFYPKHLPNPAIDRAGWAAEGVACYKIFITSLLSVTDNVISGEIIPPVDVVRYDEDDPYLVVAADKGTATFSDIANGISIEKGHWLGDAFASGGSIGYDHKGMGITARGAWESVKAHFQQMGHDCQAEDFTCVGVGDMAGDVFGNGMTLSEHTRLLAAFNHIHIFLDPNPDSAKSYAERKRMFDERLGWNGYNTELISKGGGVFERSMKSIPLSAEIKEALGIDGGIASMSPTELMNAILKAPVDLVYNGGIGTYLKATGETHAQVGDKANDAVRLSGNELRAKILGEGGNLGATQLGRIEFAQNGGRVNTDFIDNSAGVDTSDHEVNIKILFAQEIEGGRCTMEERNQTLPKMTDEVAQLVLTHNINQNKALQNELARAEELCETHEAWLEELCKTGYMDRKVQFMPSMIEMRDRAAAGKGLTNPELCTLLAWTKIKFEDELLDTNVPEDPTFTDRLITYFPTLLREKFAEAIKKHQLRREIVTTELVNDFVDNAGITAFYTLKEATGKGLADIYRAYFDVVAEIGRADCKADVAERLEYQGKVLDAMKAKLA